MSNSKELNIPILDFSSLAISVTSPSENEFRKVGKEAFEAFSKIGFVYLVNHGIPEAEVKEVFGTSKKFFNFSEEVKEKVKCDDTHMQGWNRMASEKLNVKDSAIVDFKESYEISTFAPEATFPDDSLPDLRHSFERLFQASTLVALRLLRSLAYELNLNPDFFDECHHLFEPGVNSAKIRSLYYPPLPEEPRPGMMRCGEHTDYGSITLLFQDELGGLEVKNVEGEFVPATPIQGSIVVNSGDFLEIWTSGTIPSTIHRVPMPIDKKKRMSSRQAIAYFVHPDDKTQIKPLDGSDKYPEVNSIGHVIDMYKKTYERSTLGLNE